MVKLKKNFIMFVIFCLGFVFFVTADQSIAQVTRGTEVQINALPKELKRLEIKDYFVPSSRKKVGVIHGLNGNVVVIHRATKDAYFGRRGDYIYENDSINTIANSRCRIKFFNEDVVTMAAETNFNVDSYKDQRKEAKKTSFFSMLKGKAMFYTLRLFKYKDTRFKLKTPTAIVGVRGTKFGAHVYWVEEAKSSRAGIRVADSRENIDIYLTQIGTEGGGESYTNCFSEDGYLDVNGESVSPGEMYNGETGTIIPTPPEVVKAFESETEVKKEEEAGGEEEKAEGEGEGEETAEGEGGEEEGEEATDEAADLIDTGGETDHGEFIDISENVIETTQQETGTGTEIEDGTHDDIAEGKTAGRISAIAAIIVTSAWLAHFDAGPPLKTPIYISDGENYLTEEAAAHEAFEATHGGDDNYRMDVKEQSDTNMDMKVDYFAWGSVGTSDEHLFEWHHGGHYLDENGHEYLSWGWWEDTGAPLGKIAFGPGYDAYAAAEKIWEVEGDSTHADYISYLHQQGANYTYTGEAKGVFARTGGFDIRVLSGDFSCNINFGNKHVSNFSIDAKEGGTGPSVVNMTGGSGTLDNDGGFDISGFSGTINGQPLSGSPKTGASGGCAGGKAQGVGGVWWANEGNEHWAAGEFHGRR